MSGYILLYRRILENPVFKTQAEAMAFAWLVLRASWQPCTVRYKGKVIDLQRGQLAMSIRDMAEHMEWSKSRVSRFLNTLAKWDMVKTTGGTAANVITICKYNDYQLNPDAGGTVAGQQSGQQRDSSGTQNNKENKLNEDSISSLRSDIVGDDDFKNELSQPEPKPDAAEHVDHAVECWNLAAKQYGWPTVRVPINPTRRGKLKSRLRECKIDGWKSALRRAWSGYLGQAPPHWFTFDWITQNENNIEKVLDGNYDGKRGNSNNETARQTGDALSRASKRLDERLAAQSAEQGQLLELSGPDRRTG